MKIKYKKYIPGNIPHISLHRVVPGLLPFRLSQPRPSDYYLTSNAVFSDISETAVAIVDKNDEAFINCLFKNITKLFQANDTNYNRKITFTRCTFDNVDFGDICFSQILFENCVFRNCRLVYMTPLRICLVKFFDCVYDAMFWRENPYYMDNFVYPTTGSVLGNAMFISDDIEDLYSYGSGVDFWIDDETTIHLSSGGSPNGKGYVRHCKAMGSDFNSPNLQCGIYGSVFANMTGSETVHPEEYFWTPSYACNESKQIILFNNQNYIDLNGDRQDYFEKAITEITLDFTSNGLTKEDMAAIKDIYTNKDNEITIYPYDDDDTNYIVGRLSKSDLDYSKIINSYWDNGKIDNERFKGVRLVIRVTDDSHFTGGV
jgi:hypothetical protein